MYNENSTNNGDIVFVTDILENIKPRDKDAFRIIVSSGVSEEKDAKELIIDIFVRLILSHKPNCFGRRVCHKISYRTVLNNYIVI